MNTLSSNRLRSSSATSRSAKTGDRMREGSLRVSSTLNTGWSKNTQSHSPLRPATSSIYQVNTCLSAHDLKRPEEKTSEETILVEVDGNAEDYLSTATKQKAEALLRRHNRNFSDYPDINVSQAVLAMQKLQRLKELQRRRDLTEKYYSHEIKKLIGDYFDANPRLSVSPVRYNERLKSPSVLQSYFSERSNDTIKSLEPCGTMTTITRLDCGCIQETTRPIFTTTRGRVQKKTCNQSQDQVLLKLTSSNPQEHLCSSIEPKSEQYVEKLRKSRIVLDGKAHDKNSMNLDRELSNIGDDHRGTHNKQETHGKCPGNVPTSRKSSDTSMTSA